MILKNINVNRNILKVMEEDPLAYLLSLLASMTMAHPICIRLTLLEHIMLGRYALVYLRNPMCCVMLVL